MYYPVYKFRNVSERDMDLLFMEAFTTDPDFNTLFFEKIPGQCGQKHIIQVERSKIDKGLGESDITVIYEFQGQKHAILIEDKIDAIAMPDQHGRYKKRGEKGVASGEYAGYELFILCPEKYRKANEEARKYEHFVSYEECRDYFESKNDINNQMRYQQICQALVTMKNDYKVDVNEVAVDSLRKYKEFQEFYYPTLKLKNDTESGNVNGWWIRFDTSARGLYIHHKTMQGSVDLTIPNAASQLSELKIIERWLREVGHGRITAETRSKSASFRIRVPIINMGTRYETWNESDLKTCLDAVQELADLAAMFDVINRVIFKAK